MQWKKFGAEMIYTKLEKRRGLIVKIYEKYKKIVIRKEIKNDF